MFPYLFIGSYQKLLDDMIALHLKADEREEGDLPIALYQPQTLYLHHDFSRRERANMRILQPLRRGRRGHSIELPFLFERGTPGERDYDMYGQPNVLLMGRPAIGKTCFVKRICKDWARGELWSKKFDCVFRFPMRKFNSKDIPPKGISLRELLMERHGPPK
jgi:hypothetical protein